MSKKFMMRRYDSIGKFLDKLTENPDAAGASDDRSRGDWAGTESLEEAVGFARYGGWQPEFAEKLRAEFAPLETNIRKYVDRQLERRMDVQGDQVDVAAFLSGEPDHMWGWVPEENPVSKRALCLLIGHSVYAGVTAEQMFVKGQALIALVRALALLGFELEIWSEETVSGKGDTDYSTLVRLHAAGDVMDESAVEFAIGNPSWLRRLLFAAQENESKAVRTRYGFQPGGGYGSIVSIQHESLVGADMSFNLGDEWFGSGRPRRDRGAVDYEAAVAWVVGRLVELGAVDPEAVES
jgi:hypothetical protein